MKSLIITISLLIGISAQAELKVGDTARYAVEMNGNHFDMLNEVLSIDTKNDAYSMKQTIFMGETQVQQNTEQEKISENDQNEGIYDVCLQLPSDFNPRYETITVLAGTFSTCHMTITDQTGAIINGYFAKVVFGFVKMTKENSTDQSDMSLELKEYKKNFN